MGNPVALLQPFFKLSVLSSTAESRIIQALNEFELQFGSGIVTRTLIESIALYEITSSLSNEAYKVEMRSVKNAEPMRCQINNMLWQLKSVLNPNWLRSFLRTQKSAIR